MKIEVLTLFPEMFSSVLSSSILGRAISCNKLTVNLHNIRDYSTNKHKKVDDYPYGGGFGMVMSAMPIIDCMNHIMKETKNIYRIYMSPRGKVLDQKLLHEISAHQNIAILCGHYEGIDQRALEHCIDIELSIGDYILTGGELPAMVLIDGVARLQEGVLGSIESTYNESFSNELLEYSHYTRPEEVMGMKVPDVLLSGHHKNIEKWRHEESLAITKKNRPDLLEKTELSKDDIKYLKTVE